MTSLPGIAGLILDLAIVIFGFGLIIFVHELGHFLAARWAGIRTLAFAIGFGPAIVSYRKGLGWRRGSSEAEYLRLVDDAQGKRGDKRERARDLLSGKVSHTEYRLNALPFGGYVKMLGQEDLNPAATSAAPDSYQNTPPWKRMIVISAGVVMNLVTAAALFVLVFMIGLQTEPARVGAVRPGGPAAQAVALNAPEAGVSEAAAGLRPGDELRRINGRTPNSFNDLIMASAMARRGKPVNLEVARAGVDRPLLFSIVPEKSDFTGLLDLGVEPPRSPALSSAASPAERDELRDALERFGLRGVEPGMTLLRTQRRGGEPEPVADAGDLTIAFRHSGGEAVTLVFADDEGVEARATLEPRPVLQTAHVPTPGGRNSVTPVEHLLGFTPVMAVQDAGERGAEQGLRDGDIFARIGEVAYPSLLEGASQIRANAGETIPIVVLRRLEPVAPLTRVQLEASVQPGGTIGFYMTDADAVGAGLWLAVPPRQLRADGAPAARIIDRAGMRLVEAAGQPVSDLADLRRALLAAAGEAEGPATIELVLALPGQPAGGAGEAGEPATERRELTLSPEEARKLRSLGWTSPLPLVFFEPDQTLLRAEDPAHAVSLGLSETYRVMAMTYATFLRLFEGTVKVEHLKGPVGIAHLGTRIASRGPIWLLFFMALVSVNLAVINFLPLPIVDGGQFLFLLSEQIRGRPVPAAIQSMATMAGLLLIGAVFLVVTFNDIKALFGG
jgi:regulator of sigma E protease